MPRSPAFCAEAHEFGNVSCLEGRVNLRDAITARGIIRPSPESAPVTHCLENGETGGGIQENLGNTITESYPEDPGVIISEEPFADDEHESWVVIIFIQKATKITTPAPVPFIQ